MFLKDLLHSIQKFNSTDTWTTPLIWHGCMPMSMNKQLAIE